MSSFSTSTWRYTSRISPVAPFTQDAAPSPQTPPLHGALEDEVVARVLASFDGCAEPRLRELMRAVVTHLHAFLREVRLTEEEWGVAIAFLAAAGQITGDRRQEFILLSDTSVRPCRPSPSTTRRTGRHGGDRIRSVLCRGLSGGGHWAGTSRSVRPVNPAGWRVRSATPTVTRSLPVSRCGKPTTTASTTCSTAMAGQLPAVISSVEKMAHTGSGQSPRRRTRSRTTARSARCSSRRGGRPCGRHICTSWRRRLVTEPWSRTSSCAVTHSWDSDAVFGVKDSLIRDFHPQAPGTPTPDGRVIEGTWSRTAFDVVLAPEEP